VSAGRRSGPGCLPVRQPQPPRPRNPPVRLRRPLGRHHLHLPHFGAVQPTCSRPLPQGQLSRLQPQRKLPLRRRQLRRHCSSLPGRISETSSTRRICAHRLNPPLDFRTATYMLLGDRERWADGAPSLIRRVVPWDGEDRTQARLQRVSHAH